MAKESIVDRRLAAILVADVVGYTRQMRSDEVGTLRRLTLNLETFILPLIAEHRGRVVKFMGDGLLVEFASVVDCLSCAIEWQKGMSKPENDNTPQPAFQYRIGVNLGDVLVAQDDIYGDSVNIAARLEQVAESGGIILSDDAYRQVVGKVDAEFEDKGIVYLKNFDDPVRIYEASLSGQQEMTDSSTLQIWKKPSIAVMPFDNLSNDQEQEYFADGVTEDLISALARCRWLTVIARNSVFSYRGMSADARKVSRELGVKYVLEGSIRKAGNRVRITVQLVHGEDRTQLWSNRYDGDLNDVFALQDEITNQIVGTIEPELEQIEQNTARDRPTGDLNAWDSYQRGLWYLYRFTAKDVQTAVDLFEQAARLDPSFSQSYARLAYGQIQLGWYGSMSERLERIKAAISAAQHAVSIDAEDPIARLSLGRALALSGEVASGIEELQSSIALDPSFAQAYFALGQAYCTQDRWDEAIVEADTAIRLSPRDQHMWTFLHFRAVANYGAGRLEMAEADDLAALRQPNVTYYPRVILAAIAGCRGEPEKAKSAVERLLVVRPGYSVKEAIEDWHFGKQPFMSSAFLDQFDKHLRVAGLG